MRGARTPTLFGSRYELHHTALYSSHWQNDKERLSSKLVSLDCELKAAGCCLLYRRHNEEEKKRQEKPPIKKMLKHLMIKL